jgi:hypothetical protein
MADNKKQIEGLEFVFIELPKFHPGNRAEKKLYDLWLTFLTQIPEGSEKIPPELLEEEVTKEAVQYLESSSYSIGQLDAYDRYWDSIRTERMYYLDALYEGKAKGREETIREMVLNAHRANTPVATICAITNLSEQKIQEIVKNGGSH